MSKLTLDTCFMKNLTLINSIFILFSMLLIISLCLSFIGCGLFYFDTAGADGQKTSTFTRNSNIADGTDSSNDSSIANNSGNSNNYDSPENANDANNDGNADGAQDSYGANDKNNSTDSNQSGTSSQDIQSDSALGLYTVSEVIDGDTFSINGGERVRIAGINTPEVDQYFYEEAKEVLMLMIDKTSVRLEQDITDTDKYGRLLRYVFAGELFVNLEMVKRGFANVFTVPPDLKYTDELLEAQRYARENNLGLWEISAGYIGENIKEDQENKTGANTGQTGVELKIISVELVFDAPGNDMENINGEYAGIKNESAFNIDIGGWTVKDDATKIYEFKHYILKSGEKITLFSGRGTDTKGSFYWNNSQPVWNNDHDTLYLRDATGLLVEIYSY